MNSNMISGDNGIEVDMNMDYRYFFLSNKLYYDELSTMSLLCANSIYRNDSGIEVKDKNNGKEDLYNYKNLRIKDLMEFYGFKNVRTYYLGESGDGTDNDPSDGADDCREYKDTHKTKLAIGYRNIEYHGLYKTVIGIVIRGTSEDDDWDSDFDMGDLELRDLLLEDYEGGHDKHEENYRSILGKLDGGMLDYDEKYAQELLHFAGGYPDWTHKYHHAGFDIVANRIMEILEEYMDENHDMNINICYWITGHSMGAGVANLVGAELLHGYSGINNRTDNVYCYTFAAPNTFYLTDNTNIRQNIAIPNAEVIETYREPHGIKYRCIFNIVNDDDFVPKLPMEDCEWTRYGRTAKLSLNRVKNEQWFRFNRFAPRGNFDYYIMMKYHTNPNAVDKIIEGLVSIYDNKHNMRKESYEFIDDGESSYADYDYEEVLKSAVAYYAKPYQKYDFAQCSTGEWYYRQQQMPAYFMQTLTNALHHVGRSFEGEVTERDGKIVDDSVSNLSKFVAAIPISRTAGVKLKFLIDEGLFKVIDYPHYTESYYYLSKYISTTNFR